MNTHTSISRRHVLRAGGAAAAVAASGLIATRAWSQQRKLSFAWNATAFCLSPVVVAQERGFFEKNGLQVDLVNYTGSTDQLLESLAIARLQASARRRSRKGRRSTRSTAPLATARTGEAGPPPLHRWRSGRRTSPVRCCGGARTATCSGMCATASATGGVRRRCRPSRS
jgi:hypothetical protein